VPRPTSGRRRLKYGKVYSSTALLIFEELEAEGRDDGPDSLGEHGIAGLRAVQLQALVPENRDQVRQPGSSGGTVDHQTCKDCDAEGVLQLPGRPRRGLERIRAPRANRVRGWPKTGIHLGQDVLNPC
jgi:hypothetical protein